ncbi:MAG TPA: triose-phosphate isomerase [Dehalococcoidia bacterium]|nr:triose-phosphate isomerase [Dehalococcoidia bacterium]
MRTPLIAGNWKMNTTLVDAVALVKEMRQRLDSIGGVEKVVCPPFISLAAVREVIQGSSIKLGAQNVYFEDKGAFTGEISPLMLKGLCDYVIIGHSERRQYFVESNELVNQKVKAAMRSGLKPIMCVGELLEENKSGKTEQVVAEQVLQGLEGVSPNLDLVIAYEPVWAIGTGRAATSDQAQSTIAFIRSKVGQAIGKDVAQHVRILYGGSVTGANIADLMTKPDIDGALVGGASLKAQEFISIVEQSAAVRKR